MLEQIVGDSITVRTLLNKGGNPESYEPTFSHLAELEKSECYMTVGHLPFESSVVQKLLANKPHMQVVTVSDSINLITDSLHGHDHGVDPHVWSSAKNARVIAHNMLAAVVRIDSANAPYYRNNYSRLVSRIDSVDSVCTRLLAPVVSSTFMVMHPSLSYFARDYGLRQVSLGAEGKEHSVADTRHILEQATKSNARVFFVQKDFDASRADVISGKLPVANINPLNYNWDDELVNTARAIAR